MPNGQWRDSTRRRRLPASWQAIRRECFAIYGPLCYLCSDFASDIDHVIPGDNHSLENLRPICKSCHTKKSSAEGGRAFQAQRPKRKRITEQHPGFIKRLARWQANVSRQVQFILKRSKVFFLLRIRRSLSDGLDKLARLDLEVTRLALLPTIAYRRARV
jgi:5-methylcytosine-specific restriction enzyme A